MKNKKGFTLIELLVVIAIIALLLSIILPSLRLAKEAAKTTVCGANMHQWGLIFFMYTEDNNGLFHHGWISGIDGSGLWPAAMGPYYDSPDIRSCPSAGSPEKKDSVGFWGPFNGTPGSWTEALEGVYGSYGVNSFVNSRPDGQYGYSISDYWRKTGQKSSSEIPVLADCWWYKGNPDGNNTPPTYMGDRAGDHANSMNRFCVDRHNGNVQALFMDWSSRKVGLKELWTLKWHQSFNRSNDWTIAGNGGDAAATATRWDAVAPWMSRYNEY